MPFQARYLDEDLVEAIREQAMNVFREDVAALVPHLRAFARSLTSGDVHLADDVVQEAFLRALKYFGGFRGEGSSQSRAWLLAIVRNMAHTWRRRLHTGSSTRRCIARRSPTSTRDRRSRDVICAKRWRRCSTACRPSFER